MRQVRQNSSNKRLRGRGGKPSNNLNRVYESNGPDVKIRGTASHIAERYLALSRDAQVSGDPVVAENYMQHAEHYSRFVASMQAQQTQQGQQTFAMEPSDDNNEGEEAGGGDQLHNSAPPLSSAPQAVQGVRRQGSPRPGEQQHRLPRSRGRQPRPQGSEEEAMPSDRSSVGMYGEE